MSIAPEKLLTNPNAEALPWSKRRAVQVLSGVALSAAALTGVSGCATVPDSKPVAEAPVDSGVGALAPEETTEPAPELTLEEKIAAASIEKGLSPEEYSQAFVDRYNEWIMAGTSEEFYEKMFNTDGADNMLQVCREIAEENARIYAPALFGPDAASYTQEVQDIIEVWTTNNTEFLNDWFWNEWEKRNVGRDDVPELEWVSVLDYSELSSDVDGRKLVLEGHETANYDESMMPDRRNAPRDGMSWKLTIKTQDTDTSENVVEFTRISV